MVTTFRRRPSVSISAVGHFFRIRSAARLCTWDIRVSSTAGFRSCWWIPGRNTGPTTGMTADDLYIDYDDGYYLYNRRYPDERLAVTIDAG